MNCGIRINNGTYLSRNIRPSDRNFEKDYFFKFAFRIEITENLQYKDKTPRKIAE